MSPIIDAWNQGARLWWSWCLHSTWQGLVLLALVLAVLPLLKRASPHWRYALLFVALLKFLLPPLGVQGYGLFAWLFPPPPIVQSDFGPLDRFQHQIVVIENYAAEAPTPVAQPKPPIHPLTPAGWGLVIHVLGSFALFVFLTVQVVRLRFRLKRAQWVTGGLLFNSVASAGQDLSLRRIPRVYVSAETESPCAGGTLRKFVLLPGWVDLLTDEERRVLLAHELAHLKRWDTFCNWFQIVSQVWLWWNPAVWWLNSRIRAERELCCDDLVLSLGFAAGGDYSRLLVDVASRQKNPELAFEAMGMADSFRRLKERIDRAMDSSLRRRTRLSLVSAAVLVAIAVAVLPGARINSQSVPEVTQAQEQQSVDSPVNAAIGLTQQAAPEVASATGPLYEVEIRLVELPARSTRDESFWKQLVDARILLYMGLETDRFENVLWNPDLSILDQIIPTDKGVKILSNPKLLVESGREGHIFIGETVPYIDHYEVVNDPKAGSPVVSPVTGQIDIGFSASIEASPAEAGKIELSLNLKETRQGERKLVKNPLTGKDEPVGNPWYGLAQITNRVRVKDGGSISIVMRNQPNDTSQLIAFVTARILPTEGVKNKEPEETGKGTSPSIPAAPSVSLVTKEFQLNKEHGLELAKIVHLRLLGSAEIKAASGDEPFLKYDESTGIMTVRHEQNKVGLVQRLVNEEIPKWTQWIGDPKRELKARKYTVVGQIPEGSHPQLSRRKQVEFLKNVLRTLLYADKSIEEAATEGRVMVPDPEKGTIDIVDTPSNLAKVEEYLKSVSEPEGLQQKPDIESDTVQFPQKPDEIRARRFVIAQPLLFNMTSVNARAKRNEFYSRRIEIKKILYGSKTIEEAAAEGRVAYPDPEQGTIDIVDTEVNLIKVREFLKVVKSQIDSVNTEPPAPRNISLFLKLIQLQMSRAEEKKYLREMAGICSSTVEVLEWAPLQVKAASKTAIMHRPLIRNCSTVDQSLNAIAQLADVRVLTAPRLLLMTGQTGEISIGLDGIGAKVITSSTAPQSVERPTFTFSARLDQLENGEMLLRLEPSLSLPNPQTEPNIRKGLVGLLVRFSDHLLIDNIIDPQGIGLPGWGTYPNEPGQISKWLLMVTVKED